MSNSIFDWPASLKRFVRFTTAKAEEVNAALDGLSAGLDGVEANIARALKLPIGTADQTLAMATGQRAGLLLGFDSLGNITAIAGGGRYRGDWATATAYVVSDYFRDPVSKNIYSVVTAHAAGVLADDLTAGRVQLAISVVDVEAAKTAAAASAATAATQAANASSSASSSSISATNADTSSINAASSAASASTSATLSQDWATKTAAEVVAGQGFGAKKYALDAASSATSAAGSASTATTKAAEAAASAASISGGPVTSVSGKNGVVTLVKADVGLGNVDNTADLAKPVSTATQAALDGKQDAITSQLLSTASATVNAVVGVRYLLAANGITLVAPTTAIKGDYHGYRLMGGVTGCSWVWAATKVRGGTPGTLVIDVPEFDLFYEDSTRGYV